MRATATDFVPDFTGVSLKEIRLPGANFDKVRARGADFSKGNLMNVTAHYADFQSATFIKTNLRFADLWLANFERANLNSADLSKAKFNRANLRGASLNSAKLLGTDFSDADLQFADLEKCTLNESTTFEHTLIKGAYIGSINLKRNNSLAKLASIAFGNLSTVLPDGMIRPQHWSSAETDQEARQDWRSWKLLLGFDPSDTDN